MIDRGLFILIIWTNLIFGQEITIGGESNSNQKADIDIHLACGIGGVSSPQLNSIYDFVYTKNYTALFSSLRSQDLLAQMLSVIAVEELSKRSQLTLKSEDEEIISKVKSSNKTYYCCIGCTGHMYGKILEIFKPNQSQFNNILQMLRIKIGLDRFETINK